MPPEAEGETPAACRQTLVELFHAPLMTKVHVFFCRRSWRGGELAENFALNACQRRYWCDVRRRLTPLILIGRLLTFGWGGGGGR